MNCDRCNGEFDPYRKEVEVKQDLWHVLCPHCDYTDFSVIGVPEVVREWVNDREAAVKWHREKSAEFSRKYDDKNPDAKPKRENFIRRLFKDLGFIS